MEAGESHRSPIQVENHYLPLHRREDGTSTNVNGERSNFVRTMAPQRLFANTTPVTQPGAYNEPLPFAGVKRGVWCGSLYHLKHVFYVLFKISILNSHLN